MIKVDLEKLDKYVEEGKLRRAENDFLVQYNYSDYLRIWDDITKANRGHIYEKDTGILVCNALPKFFNYEEWDENTQNSLLDRTDFIVTKKYDGCMGLIYTYKDKLYCNSRGGFNNYVTECMWEILDIKGIKDKIINSKYNLMVEVIHPKTKILVNYGDKKELVLIAAFDKITHEEVNIDTLKDIANEYNLELFEIVDFSINELFNWQKTHDCSEEGFVLRYSDNFRVKMKSREYIRAQAFKASLDMKHMWNVMKENPNDWKDKFNQMKQNMPEELLKLADDIINKLTNDYNTEYTNAINEFNKYKDISDRDLAINFKNKENKYIQIIFAKRHNKEYKKNIIKLIEPT